MALAAATTLADEERHSREAEREEESSLIASKIEKLLEEAEAAQKTALEAKDA
eukprot:SAG11_NODE_35483_length_266_cov_0.904192_1_plen_52_part_01